jgi:undecaprenyl pyrophosphate phosphatase UppP
MVKMIDLTLLANIAVICFFLATLPSIYSLIKNRNDEKTLKSFNLVGVSLMATGQIIMVFYFVLLGDYITTSLLTPLVAYWMAIIGLKLRCINKNRKVYK